ncbi:hypothetical protein PoB_000394000 [Plakobranchus ocellatus]|uniref:Uncharacterized protein n=1 Tax=Plakobranchus ocellatus TaxID=259542 RepID=A0AAV3Y317_9GAST|nr:hypothetical protein PoB_000394000 [Plakobranchus ocellatus]
MKIKTIAILKSEFLRSGQKFEKIKDNQGGLATSGYELQCGQGARGFSLFHVCLLFLKSRSQAHCHGVGQYDNTVHSKTRRCEKDTISLGVGVMSRRKEEKKVGGMKQ